MATKPKAAGSSFNWKLPAALIALGAGGYYYTSGSDDSSAKPKAPPAAKVAASGPADLYQPADYTASYQPLKVASKDAFKPLVYKKPMQDLKEKGLPSSITGGGDWSYNGLVAIDSKVQGLMEETKTGESDFLSLGQHWKHGKVKKITDDEIVFDGDDGSPATLKMGDSSSVASKAPPLPSPNAAFQPPALAGNLNMNPLPSTFGYGGQGGFGNGGAGNGGFGNGRRGRGGRNRGGGGGGGFGGGGF